MRTDSSRFGLGSGTAGDGLERVTRLVAEEEDEVESVEELDDMGDGEDANVGRGDEEARAAASMSCDMRGEPAKI